jgi:gliding motility-associated-like protein
VSCNSAGESVNWGDTGAEDGADNCGGPGTLNGNKWNIEIPVVEGETYVLYISDWTQTPTGYSLDFSNSTAEIYDTVPPVIDSVFTDQISGCETNQIDIKFSEPVKCNRVNAGVFEITGPGGPYTANMVIGPACEVGGEWEAYFTIVLDKPFTSNGDYTLLFSPGFPPITDACDNPAAADAIPFTLNLGAPYVVDLGIIITNAICNVANGSITGLVVNGGTGELSYFWINQNGDTVGTDLDLINVKSGNYALHVHDEASCISYGGPYSIADEGAPEVNQSTMQIIDATCSDANGSITGIEVTGLEPFNMEWTNSLGQVVGNELDLVDAFAGIYTLAIRDINNCEVIVGPWEILDAPAPQVVEDNLEILANTCNLQNGTIQGISVNSNSTTLDFEWRNDLGNLVGGNEIDLTGVAGGLYTLTIIDDNNCESIAGPYLVEDFPSALVDTSNMVVQSSTCGANDGFLTNLTVSGTGPFNYEWRNTAGNLVSNSLDLLDVVGGAYTLTVYDANLCETTLGPLLIPDDGGADVDEATMVMTPSNCYGDDGSITGLQVSGNPPFTYTWRDAGNNVAGTGLDLLNVPSSLYTLEIRDGNNCFSYSGPHALDNIGGADFNAVQSVNPTCELDNGRIIIDASGGVGNLLYSIDGGGSWHGSHIFEDLAPGSYTLQVLDEHDCIMDYGSSVILENEGEGVDVTASSNSPVCSGDALQLHCDIDADQYSWQGPNGFSSTEKNPAIPNASVADSGEYVLTVTVSTNSCQGVSVANVIVTESFTMDLQVQASKNPIYRGEEVVFTVQSTPQGYPGTYLWRIDGVEVQRGQDSTYSSSALMDGQVVSCEMLFSDACVINNPAFSNPVTMVVEELPMHFPNSFRPDSPLPDNQTFRPKTLLDNIVSYSLFVYDRWGNLMFETQNLDEGWDGTSDGELCPVGIYAYVARYTLQGNQAKSGETYEKSGSVNLLR